MKAPDVSDPILSSATNRPPAPTHVPARDAPAGFHGHAHHSVRPDNGSGVEPVATVNAVANSLA